MQSFDIDADQEILVAIEPSQNRVFECRASESIALSGVRCLCFGQTPVFTSSINVPEKSPVKPIAKPMVKPMVKPTDGLPDKLSRKLAGLSLADAGLLMLSLLRKCQILPLQNLPGSTL